MLRQQGRRVVAQGPRCPRTPPRFSSATPTPGRGPSMAAGMRAQREAAAWPWSIASPTTTARASAGGRAGGGRAGGRVRGHPWRAGDEAPADEGAQPATPAVRHRGGAALQSAREDDNGPVVATARAASDAVGYDEVAPPGRRWSWATHALPLYEPSPRQPWATRVRSNIMTLPATVRRRGRGSIDNRCRMGRGIHPHGSGSVATPPPALTTSTRPVGASTSGCRGPRPKGRVRIARPLAPSTPPTRRCPSAGHARNKGRRP
jgi:hypothetical protein